MKRITGIALTALAFLSSCKEDFLERDLAVTQSKEDIFANATLAGQLADKTYTFVINDYGRLGAGGQPFRGCVAELGDEAVSGNQEPGIKATNDGKWLDGTQVMEASATNNTSRGLTPYLRCFQGIRNANLMLENVATVPWGQSPNLYGPLVKAQMHALRAYFYFEMAKRWGGMPLYDKALQLDANGSNPEIDKPRASFDETIAFIEKDLDEAERLFDSVVTFTSTTSGVIYTNARGWNPNYLVAGGTATGDVSGQNGRMDLGIVRALRSRVTLLAASPLWNASGDAGKWTKAAEAAKEVIDMNRYALQSSYRTLLEVPTSPEYIFYVIRGPRQTASATFFSGYVMATSRGGTLTGLNPTQNHVDLYEMRNGRRITDAGSGYSLTTPYANRDPRLAFNVIYNTHPWPTGAFEIWSGTNATGATVYGRDAGSDFNRFTATGYYSRKMWHENLGQGNSTGLINYVVIRYGEILLNYAEAINEAGNPTLAAQAVDQIRTRADVAMPSVAATLAARGQTLTKENMRDLIRNERAVELAFEDVRWWDILRWKQGVQLVAQPMRGMDVRRVGTSGSTFTYAPATLSGGYQKIFLDFMHLYPIPRTEIVKSAGILQQNPVWPTN